MFESVTEKFDKYWHKMAAENRAKFNLDLASEVRKRLEQLDYLYKIIIEKGERHGELSFVEFGGDLDAHKEKVRLAGGLITKPKSEEQFQMDILMFEIELFTESFYYLAHRTKVILTNEKFPFPGLELFECVGVRDARNQLIEHPEKKKHSQVFTQNFGLIGDQGPTLKPDRPEGQENIFPDAGLEANTLEFKDNLEKLLDRVLAQDSSEK